MTLGLSDISWEILKWAWRHVNKHMVEIVNTCIRLGHHLLQWHHALVVVIPKPDFTDYVMAKNNRPISLIECLSKLVEKGMFKCFLDDIDRHCLVPTTHLAPGCS